MTALRFEITGRSARSRARVGRVTTLHGSFDTPAFMPVGTRGTVKGILPHLLAETGAQICLGNTYHLMLRPSSGTVARLGGLQRFSGWNRPMLTDSGGYQAFSMADINRVTDDGVTFKSIIDGAMVELTPERAVSVQNELGADIIMAFDDCPPSAEAATRVDGPDSNAPADPRLVRALRRDGASAAAGNSGRRSKVYDHATRLAIANERTVRWLERCKVAHRRPDEQSLFGIVQGGTDPATRTWCAERVCAIDLPGYAIGGVAVGEAPEQIAAVVRHTAPLLPENKPRYLMGVGYERDLLAAVLAGVDMFDCVLPTRNGRNANAFTPTGQMRLRNSRFTEDPLPIETGCDCAACRPLDGGPPFSRGYLRHLFISDEMLGPILVTLHNLRYFQRFMQALRVCIASGSWQDFVREWPVAAPGLDPALANDPGKADA